jgi:hypothetical protein
LLKRFSSDVNKVGNEMLPSPAKESVTKNDENDNKSHTQSHLPSNKHPDLQEEHGPLSSAGAFSIPCKLKKIWKLATTLNIKKNGDFQYSIIPEDLLMREYYKNKSSRDLLQWMGDSNQFIKLKINQILMHLLSLIFQST